MTDIAIKQLAVSEDPAEIIELCADVSAGNTDQTFRRCRSEESMILVNAILGIVDCVSPENVSVDAAEVLVAALGVLLDRYDCDSKSVLVECKTIGMLSEDLEMLTEIFLNITMWSSDVMKSICALPTPDSKPCLLSSSYVVAGWLENQVHYSRIEMVPEWLREWYDALCVRDPQLASQFKSGIGESAREMLY